MQLCRLGYNPKEFPFVDQPEKPCLEASIGLLERLECISEEGTRWKITKKGERFSGSSNFTSFLTSADSPFDPRMSQFVDKTKDLGDLLLGAQIAAILTAPGSVFFMGGSSKQAKEESRARVASAASIHESDILFLLSVFKGWNDAGRTENSCCVTCSRKASESGCRFCRSKYAKEKGLNNKVLDCVSTTVKEVCIVSWSS